MLSGNNGVLTRAGEARYVIGISQFDEQTKLASMTVRASIEANKVSKAGYIATTTENLQILVYFQNNKVQSSDYINNNEMYYLDN